MAPCELATFPLLPNSPNCQKNIWGKRKNTGAHKANRVATLLVASSEVSVDEYKSFAANSDRMAKNNINVYSLVNISQFVTKE